MRPNKGGVKPNKLICGMTQPTAQRYIVVRKELDLIISRVHKAGYWLSEFDKVKTEGLCHTLSVMGVMIIHSMAQVHDYLENEFVSLDKVYDAVKNRKE